MPVDHFVTTQDGLRLYACGYGDRTAPSPAVVCLPGLTRTGADFEALARALAHAPHHPRHVVAVDSRGRGRSDYDPDWRKYTVAVELADVLAVLTALEIERAVIVGTSRGGILAILLASARPDLVAGIVLNDIGPVIEPRGLAYIKSYVGKLPAPQSFEHAADILRQVFGAQFPGLCARDWMDFARRTFKEQQGKLVPAYDARIANTLDDIDLGRPIPSLWREFDALAGIPMMLIRGENSELLSRATVAMVQERRPDIEVVEVPGQGHPPLLTDSETIQAIGAFVSRCR
jgi:pimeloyl-ACP methyl ester carboxylesterase